MKVNVGDIKYFVRGNNFGKCEVVGIVDINRKEGKVLQYQVRQYGNSKEITIHRDELYNSYKEATDFLIKAFKDSYEEQVKKIKAVPESKFDKFENEYQKKLKENNNG